jgi:hypothetical protein
MFHLQDLYSVSKDPDLLKLLIGIDSLSTMIVVDPSGIIRDFNSKFETRSGFFHGDVLGCNLRNFVDFIPDDFWTTVQEGEIWKGDLNFQFKSGASLLSALSFSIFEKDPKILLLLFEAGTSKETVSLEPVLRDIVHSMNNWISALFANMDLMKYKINQLEEDGIDNKTILFFRRRIENLENSIENGNTKIQQIRKLL